MSLIFSAHKKFKGYTERQNVFNFVFFDISVVEWNGTVPVGTLWTTSPTWPTSTHSGSLSPSPSSSPPTTRSSRPSSTRWAQYFTSNNILATRWRPLGIVGVNIFLENYYIRNLDWNEIPQHSIVFVQIIFGFNLFLRTINIILIKLKSCIQDLCNSQ